MKLPTKEGAVFSAIVKPRATQTQLKEFDHNREAFIFDINAEPDKGKANTALLKHLKKTYHIDCDIISGESSRKKLLRVRYSSSSV